MNNDIESIRKKQLTEIKGGFLGLLILMSLDRFGRPTYGYEIKQLIKNLSDGIVQLYDGSIYTILKRFEKYKIVESFWGKLKDEPDVIPPRKYYKLTEKGKLLLEKLLQDYDVLYKLFTKLKDWRGDRT